MSTMELMRRREVNHRPDAIVETYVVVQGEEDMKKENSEETSNHAR